VAADPNSDTTSSALPTGRDVTLELGRFVAASPSPYHVAVEVVRRLEAEGFAVIDERQAWPAAPGRYALVRGGTVVAWATDAGRSAAHGFRIVGAHTDSPNLRVRPRPDTGAVGFRQLGVEVYGGALLNSWLDRDLGLSGRIAVAGPGGAPQLRLFRVDEPLLRIPQLAIHLDRQVNADGLKVDPQQHLVPVWGTGTAHEGDFRQFLADQVGVGSDDVLGWDAMVHDLTGPTLLGTDRSLFAAPRIDNQLSCHAATAALTRAVGSDTEGPVPVICLFDHEEVGSETASGAGSSVLPTVLERIAIASGLDRDRWFAALAASACLSADGAHATHPNYVGRHEPGHLISVNGGPVVKHNANARYATDAAGVALVATAARQAGVPLQHFVTRGDMPCGSTIGPVTAARLGITTVDVGVAQLSMHSARELCGADDPARFVDLLGELLVLTSATVGPAS
ncbi:MAG TPA: M18 family aminopeptidase, partial [Acidimicrobiales bacterium]